MPRLAREYGNPLSAFLNTNPYRQMEQDRIEDAWESGAAQDAYKQTNPEMQRQAGVLNSMNQRTDATMAHDLEDAEAVRHARNLGFNGSYPLREQDEYTANQKLQLLLKPQEAELAAEEKRLAAQQAFTASQNEQNRVAANQRAAATQTGADQRSAANRAHQMEMAQKTGRIKSGGDWDWLTSLMPGEEEDEPVAVAPAAPLTVGRYSVTVR